MEEYILNIFIYILCSNITFTVNATRAVSCLGALVSDHTTWRASFDPRVVQVGTVVNKVGDG